MNGQETPAEHRTGPIGTRFSQILVFDAIDSTNSYLLESGAPGTVAVARHQTDGRGRRGRVWDSKPGSSLLFSVLFTPTIPPHRYAQAVGLAVLDACRMCAGFDATLKWPNDVLVGKRKLAGVLAEANTRGNQSLLVVGCGLNLNWKGELPENLQAISADEAAGHALDFDAMLDCILRALDERLRRPDGIAEAYRKQCSTIGQQVRIEQADSQFTGMVIDVDDDGLLVLDDGERISIGDVVHLRTRFSD